MTERGKSWLDLPSPPPATGLYEIVLEVSDLRASERFYSEAIGLPVADRWSDERPAVWLALGNEGFLGLWPRESGGAVAIHNGRGGAHVHFALRIPHGTIEQAQARLEELGHEVERVDFGNGNVAIYLDDPDGNVVELTEIRLLWDGSASAEAGNPPSATKLGDFDDPDALAVEDD
ncbi:MAG: VOC family protein [Thermomicrobiales bacterium]|nr:VOC family protein [Thermomicrobiales bacterium]MCO5223199.1 VOC family protein [Thermomicrobiales bacterium]